MALAAVNIWTGAPLLAVWIGSRVVTATDQLTMGVVFLIAVVMFATCLALIYVLNAASLAYDRLIGRPAPPRQQAPWLKSMRAERATWARDRAEVTLAERLLVVSVVLAMITFEVWFFFFSGSSI